MRGKLVRDLIPEIIEAQGKTPVTQTVTGSAYRDRLRTKLREEVAEYLDAGSDDDAVKELADVLEVIFALARVHGVEEQQLEAVRMDKRFARGGFEDGVVWFGNA